MNRAEAEEYLKSHKRAVLATIRKDGRPQLSNVLFVYDGESIRISITETRAKYHNLVRDPRASVLVLSDNFFEYLVVDGKATFTRLPDAHEPLRQYYLAATGGPHPNWEEYDRAMREEKRVILAVSTDSMYPLSG